MNNVVVVYHSAVDFVEGWLLLFLLLLFPVLYEAMNGVGDTSILKHDCEVNEIGNEENHALVPKDNTIPSHGYEKRDSTDIDEDVSGYRPPVYLYRLKQKRGLKD